MRLKPYTDTHPKPLIEIYDKPIIDYIIEWLTDNGATAVTVSELYDVWWAE